MLSSSMPKLSVSNPSCARSPLVSSPTGLVLIAAIFTCLTILYAQPALAASWLCERGGETRRIWVEYPQGGTLPCEVMYMKSSSANEPSVLWNASATEGYCESRSAEFVERHAEWGWACDTTSTTGRPESTLSLAQAGADIREQIDTFLDNVKIYLWNNAQGRYPGDVSSDTIIRGDVNLDGQSDYAMIYVIANQGGRKTAQQFLQVFLHDAPGEFVPATSSLYRIKSDAGQAMFIDRIRDGVIELSSGDATQIENKRIRLVDARFIDVTSSNQ